jgi:hypothetical protein
MSPAVSNTGQPATVWDHIQSFAAQGVEAFWLPANSKKATLSDWPGKATRDISCLAKWFAPGSSHASDNWAAKAGAERKNPTTGETERLTILDLDRKDGKDGVSTLNTACEAAGLKLDDFGDTLTVQTPSGGIHLYYWSALPVAQGAGVLGKHSGVDVRAGNGYVVGPASVIDGKAYSVINDAPIASMGKLASLFKGAASQKKVVSELPLPGSADPDRARIRAIEYLKTAPRAVQGNSGDEITYKVACRLKDFGCTQAQAEELMLDHWNPHCSPPWSTDELGAKVANAYKYGTDQPGAAAPEAVFDKVPAADAETDETNPLQKLNAEYAFLQDGHILRETVDSKGRFALRHMSPAAFNLWFKNKPFQVGKRTVPLSEAWLEWSGRRQYEGIVFDPRGAHDQRWFNLWHGFAVEPADSPDHPMVERFLEHSLQNVCGADRSLHRWLIGFFAQLIQRPWQKPLVCLVFRGRKGTGKNALIERIVHLLGCHGLVVTDRRYLVSNFNTHLENCLLLILDEAFWSGDKEGEGKLKGLITGAQHVIEPKNLTPYQVENLTRVCLIGNEKWLVPASSDERRFAVFEVGDGRIQDRRYFEELRLGLDERGGDAHLLRYLLDYDLAGIDLNKAPSTRGLAEQKDATLVGTDLFWRECADVARVGDATWNYDGVRVRRGQVYESYEKLHKGNRYKFLHKSEVAFWKETFKLFPQMLNREIRVNGYRAVDLIGLGDARKRIHEYLGVLDEWAEEPAKAESDSVQPSNAGRLFAQSEAGRTSIFD